MCATTKRTCNLDAHDTQNYRCDLFDTVLHCPAQPSPASSHSSPSLSLSLSSPKRPPDPTPRNAPATALGHKPFPVWKFADKTLAISALLVVSINTDVSVPGTRSHPWDIIITTTLYAPLFFFLC